MRGQGWTWYVLSQPSNWWACKNCLTLPLGFLRTKENLLCNPGRVVGTLVGGQIDSPTYMYVPKTSQLTSFILIYFFPF